jgi:hypothetical protein
MPTYLYLCEAGHEFEAVHGMRDLGPMVCECGQPCKRKPQSFRVNWGQIRGAELHPNIKKLIDTAPERRDRFAKEHEEHEARTAKEYEAVG